MSSPTYGFGAESKEEDPQVSRCDMFDQPGRELTICLLFNRKLRSFDFLRD
jgi:hypothetical protein